VPPALSGLFEDEAYPSNTYILQMALPRFAAGESFKDIGGVKYIENAPTECITTLRIPSILTHSKFCGRER
jgi:hypothetical protein